MGTVNCKGCRGWVEGEEVQKQTEGAVARRACVRACMCGVNRVSQNLVRAPGVGIGASASEHQPQWD